jgi:hypothetical protein
MNTFKESARRFLIVRFEDLIRYPEATMRTVTTFLGVNYTSIVLRGAENTRVLPEYRSKIFDESKTVFEEDADQKWIDDIRPELIANGYV